MQARRRRRSIHAQVHPGARPARASPRTAAARSRDHARAPPRGVDGRADLLALVAAVEAVAERDAELVGQLTLHLHVPGQAAPGVDHSRSDDRSGGAAVDAAGAAAAAVRHRRRPVAERGVGQHRAEHEPAALPGQQHVRALAVPTDPGTDRGRSVDQGVLVGQHTTAR